MHVYWQRQEVTPTKKHSVHLKTCETPRRLHVFDLYDLYAERNHKWGNDWKVRLPGAVSGPYLLALAMYVYSSHERFSGTQCSSPRLKCSDRSESHRPKTVVTKRMCFQDWRSCTATGCFILANLRSGLCGRRGCRRRHCVFCQEKPLACHPPYIWVF